MIQELVQISIGGAVRNDLVTYIEEVEVEEHTNAADVFRIRISLSPAKDGTWKHLDDEDFKIWNTVSVTAGYPNDHARLIDGHITHIDAGLSGTNTEGCHLEISGMDHSAKMDLEDRTEAWPSKSDSQIAHAIFQRHGLTPVIQNTQQMDPAISTRLQSDTDIRFLRMLAARRGFECYVQGSHGYFRPPDLSSPPQPVLAIHFGADTNLSSVAISVDATVPSFVEAMRIDPFAKEVLQKNSVELPRRKLGRRLLHELRPRSSRRLCRRSAGVAEELEDGVTAAYEPADQFVVLRGEIDSRAYRHVLRAKRLVTVKGIGQLHSGLYYVTRVRHHFTVEGYTQSFEATRNALGLTGRESFKSDSPSIPLPAVTIAAQLASKT
jgi:phage protein D